MIIIWKVIGGQGGNREGHKESKQEGGREELDKNGVGM